MSFSSETKDLICNQDFKNRDLKLAVLSGIVKSSATLVFKGTSVNVLIQTESNSVARFVFKLIKELYDKKAEIMVRNHKAFGINKGFEIYIEDTREILYDLGVSKSLETLNLNDGIPKKICKNQSGIRAFIKGLFLGVGSVNDPGKSYHLEFVFNSENLAHGLVELLSKYELDAKLVSRRSQTIVYIKDSNKIIDTLNLLDADTKVFAFEDMKVLKEFRNKANRMRNCDTANVKRSLDTAYRQCDAINGIIEMVGFDKIPMNLQEIARLRIENPEADLMTLGEMMIKPVGKSAVSGKLKKLEEFYRDIK